MCLGVENLTLRRDSVAAGEAISTLLAMGIVLDVIFQLALYHSVHPGAALLVGPILICPPLRAGHKSDKTRNVVDNEETGNATVLRDPDVGGKEK